MGQENTKNMNVPELSESDRQKVVDTFAKVTAHRAIDDDIETVSEQLGRYPRGMVAVGARCVCGTPLAVVTRPLIDGKIPFPTSFYLTGQSAVKAMSHLEANGVMADLQHRLESDEKLQNRYMNSHLMYLEFRHLLANYMGDSETHIEGISAGGMPFRIKCLHALLAQTLVFGPGVNPIGDAALKLASDEFSPQICRCVHKVSE